jgi:prolyl-tRNA editing enzyme YbaK/EbsC (Cys-tRNA(Pro) deacylase)
MSIWNDGFAAREPTMMRASDCEVCMPTIEDVKRFLAAQDIEVLQFEEPTPTSETAAGAVGCSVGEIAKTVLFIVGGTPIAVVTAGDMKVRGAALKAATGLTGRVRLPDADEVQAHTGYRPGGVCPFLLPDGLRVVLDASLRRFDVVYPAAGDDHSAVRIGVDALIELTGAEPVDMCVPR